MYGEDAVSQDVCQKWITNWRCDITMVRIKVGHGRS